MSFPKGSIWQSLRRDCLTAIPPESRVNYASPIGLAGWVERGFYTVSSVTARRFELVAAVDDFGSALLTDVELLLDSAAEHQVSLWRHVNTDAWLSPAWMAVTFYYWAFYLGQAITRLTGRTAWFVNKKAADSLKRLGPMAPASPGYGCFRLTCGPSVSVTDREVILEKAPSRVHDELWRVWSSLCDSRLRMLPCLSSTSLEERLFTCIARAARKLGPEWPSAFRNVVNYHVGFAYTSVRKLRILGTFGYLRTPQNYHIEDLVARFERSLLSVQSRDAMLLSPQTVCNLLVDYTFILHSIATELHIELISRNGLDRRWQMRRLTFLRSNNVLLKNTGWPY